MSSTRMETVPIEAAFEATSAAPGVLSSWKEIANYLGKGVRTVQRWERDLALPIHRPGPAAGIVLAYAAELDRWIHSRTAAGAGDRESDRARADVAVNTELLLTLMNSCFFLAERCSELEAENRRLQGEAPARRARSMKTHLASIA